MFSMREYGEPSKRLSDRLPWAGLIAPGVVLQKDEVLQKTVRFRGPDLASSLKSELVSTIARLNNALKRLGAGWSFFIEAQRFESNSYPNSEWPCEAARIVDEERRRHFQAQGSHYESLYFLTFAWRVPPASKQALASAFYQRPIARTQLQEAAVNDQREVAGFQRKVREVMAILEGVFPEVHEMSDDETLTYLHSTISTHRHPVKTPETPFYLDALLPDEPFQPGEIPMLGEHYLSVATVTGFPGTTLPGLLDALNHLQLEYRWATRFICMDADGARGELEKYRHKWWQKRKTLFQLFKEEASKQETALVNTAAESKAADANEALEELGEDLVAFGYLTTTIVVWDRDYDEARRKSESVRRVLNARGFVLKEETLNALHAWLGSLPGHVYPNVRRPIVHTINLAHMMPVSSVWAGDRCNGHLEKVCGVGDAHIVCSTTGDTPFRLNLAVGDVGHTLIIGPTGAGKSTLVNMLALQWLKYPGAQVIVFDKDRSARGSTMAVGGHCYEPGLENARAAFQPLARVDDDAERIWASQFVLTLLRCQNVAETPAIKSAVDTALRNLASDPEPSHRTLTIARAYLASQDASLGDALRPYTVDGNFGHVFDATRDDLRASFWTMIEMGHLMQMGEEAIIPALEYLFHRVEQRFDGRPTLLVLDEAWLFLGHAVFASRLQAWLKTLRKKNVYVVFATQEVADAAQRRDLLSTILSACHSKIFLPDKEALTPAMQAAYADIGLSATEVQLLARAQPKRDYYYRSVRGRRFFNLNLGSAALAFVGMVSPQDHAVLDGIVAERTPTDYARAMLEHRGVEWAVRLLADSRKERAA